MDKKCNLCSVIYESVAAYEGTLKYPWLASEEGVLVKHYDKDSNTSGIGIYVGQRDEYFSRVVRICNYCPECGRKLVNHDS